MHISFPHLPHHRPTRSSLVHRVGRIPVSKCIPWEYKEILRGDDAKCTDRLPVTTRRLRRHEGEETGAVSQTPVKGLLPLACPLFSPLHEGGQNSIEPGIRKRCHYNSPCHVKVTQHYASPEDALPCHLESQGNVCLASGTEMLRCGSV